MPNEIGVWFVATYLVARLVYVDNCATKQYNCVMIPSFDKNGNLPPGIYTATLLEIEKRFVYNAQRVRLFEAFRNIVKILEGSNCQELYLNGSFITDNARPNDYDFCFEPTGMRPADKLKKILRNPEETKQKYLGDIFIRFPEPPFYFDHVVEWQRDRDGNAKGIIRLLIRNEYDQE